MQKSKLIDVIKTFEAKDYRRTKDLLNSPFFNKNEELIPLLEYIQKNIKKTDSKALDRETVYKKVFPGKKYDEKHLGYLQSDMLKMIEKYLIHSKIEEDQVYQHKTLAQNYNQLKLDKHFSQNLKKADEILEAEEIKDSNYYYQNYQLFEIANKHYERKQSRKFDDNIQNAVYNLDQFYLINKLKASCEMINRQQIISGEYEIRFIENILNYIETHEDHEPAVLIYYRIYLMLNHIEDRAHFDELKSTLQTYQHLFPKTELRDMYGFAINYAIKKINQGNPEFLNDLFELYKIILEGKIAYDSKYLSQFTFKNAVEVALRVQEYDWLENFMNQYKEDLDPSLRDNAYSYNMAKLYHHQGKYKEALTRSLMVEYNDIFYALGTRLLQLKIYFETDDIDPLLALLESFKVYLKRNKLIAKGTKEPYLNLLKYVHKATRIPYVEKEKFESLIQEIETTKNVISINWLKEAIRKKS